MKNINNKIFLAVFLVATASGCTGKYLEINTNGRNVFTSNGSGSLSAAVIQVFRESDYKELVPFDFKTGSLRIYGLLSRATLTRTNRKSQYYFVNGRVVSSKTLEKGVDAGYKERIFEGRYPIAFIYYEIGRASCRERV